MSFSKAIRRAFGAGGREKLITMDKKSLSERDICTKFITPALRKAGWDETAQIREEVNFTKGRIIVRGKLVSRGKGKRADYILYYKPNIPIALIEARVDTLMACCDLLEASLASGGDTRRRLLDALLYEALEPAAVSKSSVRRIEWIHASRRPFDPM